MMSDLDQWWNAPSEPRPLTEEDLRQALEECRKARWKPEMGCIQDEAGRCMIVMLPYPQEEETP